MDNPQLRRLAGNSDHSRASFYLAQCLSSQSNQYKVSKIRLSITMIAVTPAMESTKASLAASCPTNLAVFIANIQLSGCRDPKHMGLGDWVGVVGATTTSAERTPLSVVPDVQGARMNIKKLPLILHKAAANRTDALKVLTA
jgi:hypothetical protein